MGPRWVWEGDRIVRTRRGCLEREREKLGGFVAVWGSEKVVVERESFGSGEVAQFIGFNGLPHKHRKLCRFKKMLIPITELTTCSHIFNKQWHTYL